MANGGWYGTDGQWAHFEAALLPIDPNINGFAGTSWPVGEAE